MKLVSVNVGLPRPVEWRGRRIMTGIFKEPVAGRVAVRRLNLAGDGQADLSVHGGVHKAVYAYPSEHYPFWRRELELTDLPWGAFGENLTTEGWWEDEVHVGDRFRAGTAEFVVAQPRTPCFKLALKFDRDDVVDRFLESGRPGFYLAVVKEGELGAGDPFERIHEDERHVSVVDVVNLYLHRHARPDVDLLRRVVEVEALPEAWREHFRKRL
ncbi:MAG: MOSC domain-containing protein [Acidobacteria bacterium]|nr:MOSC domain-containing protein [Acidobacteriota bacterium]